MKENPGITLSMLKLQFIGRLLNFYEVTFLEIVKINNK